VKVDDETLEAMKVHARETYPDECCGWLVGLPGGDTRVVRMRNYQDQAHADDPERFPRTARTAYYPHPTDLLAATELVDSPGHCLLAMYHSHPDHDAYFSEEDLAQATPFGEPTYPEALQIVVSVYDGEVRDVKAFAWSADSAGYEGCAVGPEADPGP